MNKPYYITTVQNAVKNREQDRQWIQEITEQFLNQGGKIKQLGTTTAAPEVPTALSTEHNKKVSLVHKKNRDRYRDSVKKLLTEGLSVKEVIKELDISYHIFTKIVEEDDLEHLLNQGKSV